MMLVGLMLGTRATGEELMDADDLAPDTYAAVLRDLARVNTVTRARAPTLAFLGRVARKNRRRLRILDVGFGDGDMLRAIAGWAKRAAVEVELVGVDLNPRSAPAAARSTPADLAIDYRTGDYADFGDEGWDVILSSLVAHHMTHNQLVAFLRFMDEQARAGWFVNDLHRQPLAYLGYAVLSTLARWHPIVRHDGRLSVARSYRRRDWDALLVEAGVTGGRVFTAFPYRLCVERLR